jgi:predicted MPP superfamily phosphohydrolase
LGAAAGAAAGWGWFEAGWVRLRELELEVPGLPSELDGLRIVHLSDFHLGVPSRGGRAVERGVEWAAERRPDLVCITGDLLTHPRGEPRLRSLVERLPPPVFAVLGNHDYAIARDPQARASNLRELEPARLLLDEGQLVELRGRSVWVGGVDPRPLFRREVHADPNSLSREADFRILLSHFPRVLDRLEPGRFELVLAGHMHDGQITVPYPGGKLRLAHLKARYASGVYRREAAVMHVSPGLGTTFVPFRFFARPEATELVLRSP